GAQRLSAQALSSAGSQTTIEAKSKTQTPEEPATLGAPGVARQVMTPLHGSPSSKAAQSSGLLQAQAAALEGVPTQTPSWQASSRVQLERSLHGVPSGRGVEVQAPSSQAVTTQGPRRGSSQRGT